jgi:hypothetical protein
MLSSAKLMRPRSSDRRMPAAASRPRTTSASPPGRAVAFDAAHLAKPPFPFMWHAPPMRTATCHSRRVPESVQPKDCDDVLEMVLDLMHGVASQPGEITVGSSWPVIDEPALPGGVVKAIEDERAQSSGHLQLSQDLVNSLVDVAAKVHALVPVHARAAWPLLNLGQDRPVPLNEQHVPHVADVFMSGPHVRLWPASGRFRRSAGQRRTVTAVP